MSACKGICDPHPSKPLSLAEVHALLSLVLETLHHDNLRLQSRLGEHINDMPTAAHLIGELQSLDVQSQIIMDLANCLSGLSVHAPDHSTLGEFSLDSLFRLDATRLAFVRGRGTTFDASIESNEESILFQPAKYSGQ